MNRSLYIFFFSRTCRSRQTVEEYRYRLANLSMPNKHGSWYKSNSASDSSTSAVSMPMHEAPLQIQLQCCCGGHANAMQTHSHLKHMLPVRQDDLPTGSRPCLGLTTLLSSAMWKVKKQCIYIYIMCIYVYCIYVFSGRAENETSHRQLCS